MHSETVVSKVNMRYKKNIGKTLRKMGQNYELYLFLVPAVVYIIIFHYAPMYGVQIAFKEYIAPKGITGSPWVGFAQFERFLRSYSFWTLIKNTVGLNVYGLIVGFPVPIILALMLNSLTSERYKKIIQTATYAPYFISTVVIVSMMMIFLSPRNGLINQIIVALGGTPIYFIAKPEWFQTLYVFSGIWQSAGWSAIIYISALAAIDPELHTAAVVDGATKLKRIIYIDIPGIMPTIIILLILRLGHLFGVGFEKAFLMQNSLNITSSEVIQTYVYKVGLGVGSVADYSYSAAVGLLNSVISFVFLMLTNWLSKKVTEISLW